ncbi:MULTISPECIES: DUF1992 domain-containing protein [unclassified Gordonia (in: high G+C Gram-positive bacteria)]|uniref:DnaJ family domain-containing protein n=1 Tax=unclassified Gordonia (in: high G+C Gram-positive bacteria) TaxID=2657482 RepID=UPI001F0E06A9|nr:DUF1992 domain-containing protein [Gordonia sp. ABSL49_1]MCH5643475.1 DUF1992 domain-containing protein [Gordonia sp. ABSL49_1]
MSESEGHFRRIRRWRPPVGESRVEKMIREATERGEFDNLPGMGKPLDLSDADDPDWWVKRKIRDENLDSSALLPAPLQLRKEAQGFPESLRGIADEDAVRDILTDFNRRVREAHLATRAGMPSLITAHTVDVDEVVAQWRTLRSQ